MQSKLFNIWNKTWRDKKGTVVIYQTPNAPLIIWVVASIISLLVNGHLADALGDLAAISLIIWSLLEMFKGANYFRRLLGLAVLIFSILSLIKNI